MGNDLAEKAATSAWFTIAGRGSMLVAIPLMAWAVAQLIQLKTDVQVLTATVNFNMADRYRGDDAKRDFQLRDLKIDGLSERLTQLEHEVRATKIDVKEQQIEIRQQPKRTR